MLKIVAFLQNNRSIAIFLLIAPVLYLGLTGGIGLNDIPESPYIRFDIQYSVPGRTAEEIQRKVVQPSEKILNGLVGLIAMRSTIQHHKATTQVRFDRSVREQSAYLYIQEKMDRIRLVVPRDVKSIEVRPVHLETPPNLRLHFASPVDTHTLSKSLAGYSSAITNSNPNLDSSVRFDIEFDLTRLTALGLSLSDAVKSLQSLGISTSIGRKNQVSFQTGLVFQDIEEVKRALISSVKQRPIRLSDVAQVRIANTQTFSQADLWVDTNRISVEQMLTTLRTSFGSLQSTNPRFDELWSKVRMPVAAILILFILQAIFFRMIFGSRSRITVLISLYFLICSHYFFWSNLIGRKTDIFDLHSLVMTLLVGTFFLTVVYARIRSYLSTTSKIQRPQISVEQATLFTLGELLPTFIVFLIGWWIVSLPLLNTSINLPSQHILSGFFNLGAPISIISLLFLPSMINLKPLAQMKRVPHALFSWSIPDHQAKIGLWGSLAVTLFAFLTFSSIGIGLRENNETDGIKLQLAEFRGYSSSLEYNHSPQLRPASMIPVLAQKNSPTRVWTFSPSGMRFLGGLDLVGFQNSVVKYQERESFGHLPFGPGPLPLQYSGKGLNPLEFGNYLISGNEEDSAIAIRHLTHESIQSLPSTYSRDNLVNADISMFKSSKKPQKLNRSLPEGVKPSPWSQFILQQIDDFYKTHLISLVFLYLLFSLYLNSFLRGLALLVFSIAPVSVFILIRWLLPGPTHADSLWLVYFTPAFITLGTMVLARVIDVERSRGFDRDLCIDEIRTQLSTPVFYTLCFVATALLVTATMELLPFLYGIGLWTEGAIASAALFVLVALTAKWSFPLFYSNSEELIDNLLFKGFFVLRKLRGK